MVKSSVEELRSVLYFDYGLSEAQRAQTQPIWAEIEGYGAANKNCRLAHGESIAANRHFQQLLLASVHAWDSAVQPLAADVMLIVLQHLDGSKSSPFSHAGTQLPTGGVGFAWHRQGQAVSAPPSFSRKEQWTW